VTIYQRMHSKKEVKHQWESHIKKDTHCVRDQRVSMQEPLYNCTVNWVIVLIYGLMCSMNTGMLTHIVDMHKRYMLRKISMHSHIRHTNHWYGTLRT